MKKGFFLLTLVSGILFLPSCVSRLINNNLTHEGFSFPESEALNPGNSLEWWYFTGHFYDSLEREYGVEFVFFHFTPPGGRSYLMSNMALSNRKEKRFIYDYEIDKYKRANDNLPVNLSIKHEEMVWKMNGAEGKYAFSANTFQNGLFGFQLEGKTDDPVWLQDESGYEDYGGYATAGYYSYPNLDAKGTIMWDGDPIPVSGELWYDRQWDCLGVLTERVRWDWFGIKLDNGDNLMLYIVSHLKGEFEVIGGNIQQRNKIIELKPEDLQFERIRQWESNESGKTYTLEWNIKILDHGYDLNITTPINNQELIIKFAPLIKMNYWEGMCDVKGSHAGKAFIEMTNP